MDALSDVDVLEFSQYVAGPNCGQWLAALGANVVKLEPPQGDGARTFLFDQFSAYNLGGKESIGVDLETEEGREIARDLAAQADVIVQNFSPGALAGYGLDYESVAETNEDVIYCSISGFGETGPYSEYSAIDPLIQAMSGLMAYNGYPECPNLRGEEYTFGTSLIVDMSTGVNGALLVAAALRRRDRTGEGEFIDVSLFDTALSFMATWIAKYAAGEELPRRADHEAEATDSEVTSPFGIFEAGDGTEIYISAPVDPIFEALCRALDRPDLLEDERFQSAEGRGEHAAALYAEIQETVGEHDGEELFASLAEQGVLAGPFRDITEVVDGDPHVEARGILTETMDPRNGEEIRTATVPFRTSEGRPDVEKPPSLSADARDVLGRLGYSDDRIEELIEAGPVTASEAD